MAWNNMELNNGNEGGRGNGKVERGEGSVPTACVVSASTLPFEF